MIKPRPNKVSSSAGPPLGRSPPPQGPRGPRRRCRAPPGTPRGWGPAGWAWPVEQRAVEVVRPQKRDSGSLHASAGCQIDPLAFGRPSEGQKWAGGASPAQRGGTPCRCVMQPDAELPKSRSSGCAIGVLFRSFPPKLSWLAMQAGCQGLQAHPSTPDHTPALPNNIQAQPMPPQVAQQQP